APRARLAGRWGWAVAAFGQVLDPLPPFWLAFVYTFALGLPQCIVAIPIGAAAVGPLAAIGLIVAGGLLSCITVPSVAEAAARNGALRYGPADPGSMAEWDPGPPCRCPFTPATLRSAR